MTSIAIGRHWRLKAGVFFCVLAIVGIVVTNSAMAQSAQWTQVSDGFDAKQTYQRSCLACHNAGVSGAPMLDDKAAWDALMTKGMDAVLSNVLSGINTMPARGLCFTCTDDDLGALVEYMYQQSQME